MKPFGTLGAVRLLLVSPCVLAAVGGPGEVLQRKLQTNSLSGFVGRCGGESQRKGTCADLAG